MKKLLFAALFSAAAMAASVIELAHPFKAANGSVIEVWAYMCSHCKAHFRAHTLDKIAASTGLKSKEYLSQSMGEQAKLLANAFYYAEYLDLKYPNEESKYKQLKKAIFEANVDDLQAYESAFSDILSKNINQIRQLDSEPWFVHLAQNRASIDEVSKVHGTPGYVINGKYLINLAEINSNEQLLELASELAKK